MTETCKTCRFFRPGYYQLGKCTRQVSPGSKLFVDDGKADILVHVSFGCNQWETQPKVEDSTL